MRLIGARAPRVRISFRGEHWDVLWIEMDSNLENDLGLMMSHVSLKNHVVRPSPLKRWSFPPVQRQAPVHLPRVQAIDLWKATEMLDFGSRLEQIWADFCEVCSRRKVCLTTWVWRICNLHEIIVYHGFPSYIDYVDYVDYRFLTSPSSHVYESCSSRVSLMTRSWAYCSQPEKHRETIQLQASSVPFDFLALKSYRDIEREREQYHVTSLAMIKAFLYPEIIDVSRIKTANSETKKKIPGSIKKAMERYNQMQPEDWWIKRHRSKAIASEVMKRKTYGGQ